MVPLLGSLLLFSFVGLWVPTTGKKLLRPNREEYILWGSLKDLGQEGFLGSRSPDAVTNAQRSVYCCVLHTDES